MEEIQRAQQKKFIRLNDFFYWANGVLQGLDWRGQESESLLIKNHPVQVESLDTSSNLKYTIDDNSDEINNLEQLSKTQYGEIIMQSRGNESVPYYMSKQLMLDPN